MEQITIKDIAKICGVGVSTVSRAINNHPDINPETKAMIMDVIKEHNYVPNNSARYLKRADAKAIAVLVKGMTNPFFSIMIKIMEEEIKKAKYTLVLRHVENYEDEVDIALELVKEKRLRGIVFLGGFFVHAKEKLNRLQVPFILSTIGDLSEQLGEKEYSSIAVDDIKESYKAVDYLCKLGHKKIATITTPASDRSIGKLRLEGYMKALVDNNITIDPDLIAYMDEENAEYSLQNGYDLMTKLMESKKECSAVYAISDILAIGACKAIFDAGKSVPEDYSVVGFDGVEMAYFYRPTITTIKQPVEQMALETIQTLFDVIKHKASHQHKVFPGVLVEGESTKKYVNSEPI